jgi:hypothetical protein
LPAYKRQLTAAKLFKIDEVKKSLLTGRFRKGELAPNCRAEVI